MPQEQDLETEPTVESSSGNDDTPPVEETTDEVQEPEEEAPEVEPEPTEEPEEIDEDDAPAIVAEVMPEMAGLWSSMSAEQRQAVERTVAGLLTADTDGVEPAAPEERTVEPERAAAALERRAEPAPLVSQSLISDEQWQELELESPTACAIVRTLDQQVRTVLAEAAKTGELTLKAIESHDSVLKSVREEGELKQALDAHAKDLRRLDETTRNKVFSEATKLHSSRKLSWSESLGLAYLGSKGAKAKPGEAPSELQRRARQVASSISSKRGGRRGGNDRPPPGASLRDVFNYRARQLGME